jgi:sugar transferase (PEP-CTERM/EpsH1 system associated)
MVSYLRLPQLRDTRKVVDLVDVDSEKWFQYAASSHVPKRWLYNLEGKRLRRLERSLLGFADAIVLVSQAEADLYRQSCGDGAVYAVTNGVDLEYFSPPPNPPPPEQACVFVGAMDYRPNVEGVLWFARNVWPKIRQRHPATTFYVVGRRPAAAIACLAEQPGVVVTGAVADVRPYLARATVVVAPLRIARGVQNKLLEAMAMQRPVVATPQATTGLVPGHHRHLVQATKTDEWVAAIDRALDDRALCIWSAQAGRAYVEQHYHWSACLAPLRDLAIGPYLAPNPRPRENIEQRMHAGITSAVLTTS